MEAPVSKALLMAHLALALEGGLAVQHLESPQLSTQPLQEVGKRAREHQGAPHAVFMSISVVTSDFFGFLASLPSREGGTCSRSSPGVYVAHPVLWTSSDRHSFQKLQNLPEMGTLVS